jgi:hypothetical protein
MFFHDPPPPPLPQERKILERQNFKIQGSAIKTLLLSTMFRERKNRRDQ